MTDFKRDGSHLAYCPPVEKWDDWVEYDPEAWPRRVEKHYQLVPTVCFNCESACGMLAYVDKETGQVTKFEGNPMHPASRGRLCAKGPATINQIQDPDRILYPMKRVGPRGGGKWARVSWDEVLETFGSRIRKAIQEGRGEEVMYHVGRPGHDFIMERMLQAWGIDGHNSHTNVCSSSARLGYLLWHYADRPSPDHANARFILLLSAHLESGHYFNPHAQRIIDGKMAGAKLAVMDPRLSNTASMADYWLPTYPGTEAAVLLAMAMVILEEQRFDAAFVKKWTNWEELEVDGFQAKGQSFEAVIEALKRHYARFTPQFAEKESGVKADVIVKLAREIATAGTRFASHLWRGSASGNLGGWQPARALMLLHVLTGSVGTEGGHNLNAWNKFVPRPFSVPPPQKRWNELLYPLEWPLCTHEMSFLLPHFLKEGRGRIEAYFTRVFNPVWTYPDGFSWIEMLRDEEKVGLHAALTPTWSETAWFADYVLPMGFSSERHDLMSQESYAGKWIGFRQPVLRVLRERNGEKFEHGYQANPGEVWEEDEFWINLSWAIDPDGSMGIRQWFESPYRPGQKLTVDEYYGWIFENSVPGLPEKAKKEGLTPLQYMRKYGAFEVTKDVYQLNEKLVAAEDLVGAKTGADGVVTKNGKPVGVMVEGKVVVGYGTPSRKLELFSKTMVDWKWPEFALPEYYRSHIHRSAQAVSDGKQDEDFDPRRMPAAEWRKEARGDIYTLLPIFRLPNLIHTRSGNAKSLYEISHKNPLWLNPVDAQRLGARTGDLIKVHTEIGFFVLHAWVTEGLTPGVVACSHHLGRWRVNKDDQVERMSSAWVDLKEVGKGQWKMRQIQGVESYESSDPDTKRVWWSDAGVHQDITFPVHPDPVSGMHCWHQMVRVERAGPEDRYGDIFVDTNLSYAVYQKWKALTRPAPGPGGLRRPLWIPRVVRPEEAAFYVQKRYAVSPVDVDRNEPQHPLTADYNLAGCDPGTFISTEIKCPGSQVQGADVHSLRAADACARRLRVKSLSLALPLLIGLSGMSVSSGNPAGEASSVLLVANKGEHTLGIIDPEAGVQIATVPEEGTTGHEVVASPDGRTAYVPIYGNSGVGKPGTDGQNIAVIDIASRKIVGNVDFGHGVRPHCAVFGPKDGLLYVTAEIDKAISVIDPHTLKIVGSIPTGQPESHMLAITPDGTRGYTANVGPGTVSVLDMATRKTLAVIPVSAQIQRIAVSTDGRLIFTSDQTKPQLAVIDASTNKIKTWVPLPAPGYGTAATPDGHWLVVAVPTANKVAVVDLGSMKVAHVIDVPAAPQEILIRPDGRVAYASCDASHKIAAIRASDWTVEKLIDAGAGADGLAWAARK